MLTIACLIISAAQFFTNSPVVRTDSSDLTFHVQSYQFIDQTRAFSLFANGLDAGVFYSFMGGIATSFCLRRRTRKFGLVLFLLCAFGCYATYTRLAMVGFVVSSIAVVVISKKGLMKFSLLLPHILFVLRRLDCRARPDERWVALAEKTWPTSPRWINESSPGGCTEGSF